MKLARIDSAAEDALFGSGAFGGNTGFLWIGLAYAPQENLFYWTDGVPLTGEVFENWCSGEPNNFQAQEFCGEYVKHSQCWNDANCGIARPFVCERTCDDGNPCTLDSFDASSAACVFSPKSCDDGDPCTADTCDSSGACVHTAAPFGEFGSSGYLACAHGGVGFGQAQASCAARGMHLVQIGSQAENAAVFSYAAAHGAALAWVDLSDAQQEGDFRTSDGSAPPLLAFCPNEPNGGSTENCVQFFTNNPCWNDAACHTQQPFVCERTCDDGDPCTSDDFDPSTGACTHAAVSCNDGDPCTADTCSAGQGCVFAPVVSHFAGPSEYRVCAHGGLSWKHAQDKCAAMGMALVTLDDPAENAAVFSLASAVGAEDAWIGLNDLSVEGQFTWTNGGAFFGGFCPGEPNQQGDEDCGQFFTAAGCWNDADCGQALPFVCERVCHDADVCTSDVATAGGCQHPAIPCAPSLVAVSPTATEAGALGRSFLVYGGGFDAGTLFTVQGAAVVDTHVLDESTAELELDIEPTATSLSVFASNSAGAAALADAVSVHGPGNFPCAGAQCGACAADSACVEGDLCSVDQCMEGSCVHGLTEACCPAPGSCDPCAVRGDINANGTTNVADAMCSVLLALWSVGGKLSPAPACVVVAHTAADASCDGALDVSDIQLVIAWSLAIPLPASIDSDEDDCSDACAEL
jgi:hypothetical protein